MLPNLELNAIVQKFMGYCSNSICVMDRFYVTSKILNKDFFLKYIVILIVVKT